MGIDITKKHKSNNQAYWTHVDLDLDTMDMVQNHDVGAGK